MNLIKTYEELVDYFKEQDAAFMELNGYASVQVVVNKWRQSFGQGDVMSYIDSFPIFEKENYGKVWRCWKKIPDEDEMFSTPWEHDKPKERICPYCRQKIRPKRANTNV